jgi:hypothetical protein
MTMQQEYKGHTIAVREDLSFMVAGPHVNQYFQRAFDAREAVDEAVANAAKQSRTKISISVLSEKGRNEIVHGLHAGHGKVLGTEGDFYPDVPWLAELLKEKAKLQIRLNDIDHLSYRYRISNHWRGASKDYDGTVAQLQKEIADKTARAEAATPVEP